MIVKHYDPPLSIVVLSILSLIRSLGQSWRCGRSGTNFVISDMSEMQFGRLRVAVAELS